MEGDEGRGQPSLQRQGIGALGRSLVQVADCLVDVWEERIEMLTRGRG